MRYFSLVLLVLPVFGLAHHSRLAFDLEGSITVEGLVTEVAWTNPHYYLVVTQATETGEVDWTFEGHSIPGLVRNGWSKNSLQVGARVRVVANPSREAEVPFGLLDYVTRTDGKTFYSFKRPQGDAPKISLPLQAASGMAGTWRLIRSLRANLVSIVEPPRDWALQPLAQAEVDMFDLRDDPALRCEALGLPRMLTWPYTQHWQSTDDGFNVEIEHSKEHRRIYSQRDSVPQERSPSGVSIGSTQADGSYLIITQNFLPQSWGNGRGISSSADKRVTEHYSLEDGGYKIHLSYTLEDPLYLVDAVTRTAEFRKVHDFTFAEDPPCDVATATRHLIFEK